MSAEIEATSERIQQRDLEKAQLDQRRAEVMSILKSGGALEHYSCLQEELGRLEAAIELLRKQLADSERLESTKVQQDLERAQLQRELQNDHHERQPIIQEAILLFEELSNALYEQAGSLIVTATPNGPDFSVKIDKARSKGITNMQIFCFDLMLAELATRRGRGPGFLIHDSHLFDGVDERQVAKAIQLGASRSASAGFQYIITLNSDAIPKEGFNKEFELYQHVLEPRLTDTDTGGLFGMRVG